MARLSTDILKKEVERKLSPGQYVLLQAGLEILQPANPSPDREEQASKRPAPPNTATEPLPGTSNDPEGTNHRQISQPATIEDMRALWGLANGQAQETMVDKGKQSLADPISFGIYIGKKRRQVTDYITNMYAVDPAHDGDSTVSIGGVEFSVTKGRKMQQDKVRVPHYMEGALRILREMILEDNMPTQQIVNHVNYLIQIACFAQTVPWKRVLNYDAVYRREQHQHGFAWGTGSAFLMQSQLSPHEAQAPSQPSKKPVNPASNAKKSTTVIHPKTGKPICGKWNSTSGCDYDNCRYVHACKTCFADGHTQVQHWDQAPSQAKN